MEHGSSIQPLVLIVEDHPLIIEFVESHLSRSGFHVISAEGCAEALTLLRQHTPDLIILDVVLDDGLGYDLCATIRGGGEEGVLSRIADTPILLLTARADEEDRLRGFQSGADDYVTKPFSPEELVCRVRAILRRSNGVSHALLEIGPLQIDPRRRTVSANGQIVALTPKEFDLLHLLASSPGRVFSRENLLERVWGYSFLGNTRTVDVHVNRVRQKLAIDDLCGEMISTEWGIGYKLCAPGETSERLVALEASA